MPDTLYNSALRSEAYQKTLNEEWRRQASLNLMRIAGPWIVPTGGSLLRKSPQGLVVACVTRLSDERFAYEVPGWTTAARPRGEGFRTMREAQAEADRILREGDWKLLTKITPKPKEPSISKAERLRTREIT